MIGINRIEHRVRRAVIWVGLLAGGVVCAAPPQAEDVLLANGFDYPTAFAGGANYLWYGLGTASDACDRDPYGLLPNYAAPGVRTQALQQLATMHAAGMRSLSLGLFFMSGAGGSTVIDASDPVAVATVATNLGLLLQDATAAGFQRVLFRFFPQATMNPSLAEFDPATIDSYWNLIVALHPALAASGLPYRVDLMVEGAPRDKNYPIIGDNWKYPDNPKWSKAVRDLWRRYSAAYGTADTVGFSFLTATNRARSRVRHMKYVYEGVYPQTFAMDFYGGDNEAEADQFANMANLMHDYGLEYGFSGADWIISETWNNDPIAAAGLSSAIAATRQPVRFLTEWPLDRGASCAAVSVAPPYPFDIWRMYGF